MNSFRKIAAACLIGAFLLPATSFAHKDKKEKKEKKEHKEHKNNGKHKGWYKNPRNPHHPDHDCKHQDVKDDKDVKGASDPKSIIIGVPKGTKGEPKPTVGTKPGEGKGQ